MPTVYRVDAVVSTTDDPKPGPLSDRLRGSFLRYGMHVDSISVTVLYEDVTEAAPA